jgi:hypothetical protein
MILLFCIGVLIVSGWQAQIGYLLDLFACTDSFDSDVRKLRQAYTRGSKKRKRPPRAGQRQANPQEKDAYADHGGDDSDQPRPTNL